MTTGAESLCGAMSFDSNHFWYLGYSVLPCLRGWGGSNLELYQQKHGGGCVYKKGGGSLRKISWTRPNSAWLGHAHDKAKAVFGESGLKTEQRNKELREKD